MFDNGKIDCRDRVYRGIEHSKVASWNAKNKSKQH